MIWVGRIFWAWIAVASISFVIVTYAYWNEGRKIQRYGDRRWE